MYFLSRPEKLLNSVVDPTIARTIGAPLVATCVPTEYGYDYTLQGSRLLEPAAVFAVLRSAAPDAHNDTPYGVVDDWREPDEVSQEAIGRVKRHERMLGQDWYDFLPARFTFMEVVNAIPDLDSKHVVRRITEPDEKAAFAATTLVDCSDPSVASRMLRHAQLDANLTTTLLDVIEPFLNTTFSTAQGAHCPRYSLEQQHEVAKALKQKLLTLHPSVTQKIIDATVTPISEVRIWNNTTNNTGPRYFTPSSFFTRHYCVQQTLTSEGAAVGVPLAREGDVYNHEKWFIPGWDDFHEERGNDDTSSQVAPIINPNERRAGHRDYATDIDTIQSAPDAIRLMPKIRWQTTRDGTRRFDLSETRENNVATSGLFGLILAAAMQPELTAQWPKQIHGQPMGIAQLPVLALMHREDIANSQLITTVEHITNRPLAKYTRYLRSGLRRINS